ncbi:MAG: nucleotide exchange factor GrpE [Micrococcales bacterium 70-64]|jgi:molecular chaperone GrpE|nr:nucleotide exchange factor GrpE [Leifsonia sp.]ODU63772.1 MAG: nucleotide exchange factor GrpE [Leifsonia sp. SCN 70-46]OJX85463.1 MAG: nucleotide exchange factor GrpE [Micrococcales bacterium 70-64]
MADTENNEEQEPVIRDKRRIDPETGDVREPQAEASDEDAPAEGEPLSDEDQVLLDQAATDLVAEMRSDMLRAQAELVNFRTRVERDRQANRDAVIAEVIRSLLPAMDDLARAEAHGDLVEGAPLTLVAQKIRGAFEKYGLTQVGEKGEPFDPSFHEAVVQLPNPDVTVNTIADVIEPGYLLGERLVRPAKVAVFVPAE